MTDASSNGLVAADMSRARLEEIGFVPAGRWRSAGGRDEIECEIAGGQEALFDASNALYAFCEGDHVRYIGKTTRSVRIRFMGYRSPGSGQATNLRCNAKIREVLSRSGAIDILVLADTHQLQWNFLRINLAAGLEDALIAHFDPPWNGTNGRRRQSESAEREAAESAGTVSDLTVPAHAEGNPAAVFEVRLGATYFRHGYINPGLEASRLLGSHDDAISVGLGSMDTIVTSRINRTANQNGAVRILGSNGLIARWFQQNYREGDVVQARVLGPHRILLMAPEAVAKAPIEAAPSSCNA